MKRTLALLLLFAACNEPMNPEQSDEQQRIELAKLTDDVYYVVGSLANSVSLVDGTIKSWAYLFISENLRDTVGVRNLTEDGLPGPLFDGVYELPPEILASPAAACGWFICTEEYRYAYPVKINSHRPMKENESLAAPCFHMGPTSTLRTNKSIVVESLSKIEQ